MVLNTEKRKQLAKVAFQRKVAPGPSVADASAAAASAPDPSAPATVDHRQKGVAEATASEDEDICPSLVFKRKRNADVAVPANSASDDRAPFFRENHPSASSPRDIVVHEGEGESASEVIRVRLLLLTCPPSSNGPFNPSKIGRGWRAWAKTPCKSMQPNALRTSLFPLAST